MFKTKMKCNPEGMPNRPKAKVSAPARLIVFNHHDYLFLIIMIMMTVGRQSSHSSSFLAGLTPLA
jgi:hypothetical protein